MGRGRREAGLCPIKSNCCHCRRRPGRAAGPPLGIISALAACLAGLGAAGAPSAPRPKWGDFRDSAVQATHGPALGAGVQNPREVQAPASDIRGPSAFLENSLPSSQMGGPRNVR